MGNECLAISGHLSSLLFTLLIHSKKIFSLCFSYIFRRLSMFSWLEGQKLQYRFVYKRSFTKLLNLNTKMLFTLELTFLSFLSQLVLQGHLEQTVAKSVFVWMVECVILKMDIAVAKRGGQDHFVNKVPHFFTYKPSDFFSIWHWHLGDFSWKMGFSLYPRVCYCWIWGFYLFIFFFGQHESVGRSLTFRVSAYNRDWLTGEEIQ